MKRIIMIIMAVLVCSVELSAQDNHFCSEVAKTAALIMEKRQQEFPVRILFEVTERVSSDSENIKLMVSAMINDAYRDYPRMYVEENQKDMVRKFSNEWYLKCIEGTKNEK